MAIALLVWSLAAGGSAEAHATPAAAREWVRNAVERMGGEARWRGFSSMRIETVGYRNLLEQSERPEGPWIAQVERTTELWDWKGGRWESTTQAQIADSQFTLRAIVSDGIAALRFGEQWQPGRASQVEEAQEWMTLSPHRALLASLEAPDLRSEAGVTFQGVANHVVSFARGKARIRVLLNSQTGFLSAVETTRSYPEDLFWQVWGDVTTRVSYSFWDLRPGGLFYPMQWDIERGGRPWRSLTLSRLELDPVLPSDAFAIPEDQRAAFAALAKHSLDEPVLGSAAHPAVELAPGVVHIPGSWAVTLVGQKDGVVVLEAPISAGYSTRVMEEAARRFPGLPVKALVTTSDSWPHIGGIREYVARGVPVYLLDLNVPQIERALASPHRSHPDALERRPRRPILCPVSDRMILGQGANRLELYPFRGETGERMMMALLPESGLLYASDLLQLGRGGPPEYAWEVAQAVERNHLRVQTVFAMHTEPTPWSRVLEILQKAKALPARPAGSP